jgi:hypothetical protein
VVGVYYTEKGFLVENNRYCEKSFFGVRFPHRAAQLEVIMSAQERFGTIVWGAVNSLDSDGVMGGYHCYRTVPQIAAIGEVSIPTARKYLKKLQDMGRVKTMQWGRLVVYAPITE